MPAATVERPKPRQAPPKAEVTSAVPAVAAPQVDRLTPLVTKKPVVPEQPKPPAKEPILATTEPSSPISRTQNGTSAIPTAETSKVTPDPVPPVESATTSTAPVVETLSVQTLEPQVTLESPPDPTPMPQREITASTPTLPNRPQHGGEHCIPCPAKADCFLGGQNKLESISLGKLDDPLAPDADPIAVAARDALMAETIQIGKPQTLTYTDTDGTEHAVTGTILRVGGQGFKMLVKPEAPTEKQPVPVPAETPAKPVSTAPVENPNSVTSTVEQKIPVTTAPAATGETTSQIKMSSETAQAQPVQETKKPETVTAASVDASAAPKNPAEQVSVSVPSSSEPKTVATPKITEKSPVARDTGGTEESKTPDGALSAVPDRPRPTAPNSTIASEKNVGTQKKDKQIPPVIDARTRKYGEIDTSIAIPRRAETPKGKMTTDHADYAGNNKRKQRDSMSKPATREIRAGLIRALPNILRAGIPQKEQPTRQATDKPRKNKNRVRTRIESSVPVTSASLIDFVVRTKADALSILRDRVATIRLPERSKKATDEKQGAQETKRRRQTTRTEVFALAISGEHMKLKKKKIRKETLRGKKPKETISLKKRKTAEKIAKLTTRKMKGTRIEISRAKLQEKQTRQRRSILTEAGRVKIYERMRARKRSETQKPKNRKEQHKIETTRPLILMIPKRTPIEQIAGVVTRIAKEKREKIKTPPVTINVSHPIFVQLQKFFAEAIVTKSTKQKNSISIVCGEKRISLDVEKLQELEHLFADFETQLLLLQLRQCLIQSEIKEATVLCGCQQQDAAHTFEKITFCQGCHQGYIQQTFFWLTTIMWYTIYGMTLDQTDNQMYTQSYSYEQKIFTP